LGREIGYEGRMERPREGKGTEGDERKGVERVREGE